MVRSNLYKAKHDNEDRYVAILKDGDWIYIRNICHFYSKTHKIYLNRIKFIDFTSSTPGTDTLKMQHEYEYRKFRIFMRNNGYEHFEAPDYCEVDPKVANPKYRIRSKHNKSGYIGVLYIKNGDRWRAEISVNGKKHYLGEFKNKQDAIDARISAEELHLGSSFQ